MVHNAKFAKNTMSDLEMGFSVNFSLHSVLFVLITMIILLRHMVALLDEVVLY